MWVAKTENGKLCDESLRNSNLGAMNFKTRRNSLRHLVLGWRQSVNFVATYKEQLKRVPIGIQKSTFLQIQSVFVATKANIKRVNVENILKT